MNLRMFRIAGLLLTVMIAAQAHAKFWPGANGVYYVTNMEDCEFHSEFTTKPYSIGVYFSATQTEYDYNENNRAYLWVDQCPSMSSRELIGHQLQLVLDEPRIRGWDPTIVNYTRFEEMLSASTEGKIDFSSDSPTSANAVTVIFGSANPGSQYVYGAVMTELGGTRRLALNRLERTAAFINSDGKRVIEQGLTDDETNQLWSVIQKVASGCTAEVSVQSIAPHFPHIITHCKAIDLSMRNVPPNAG